MRRDDEILVRKGWERREKKERKKRKKKRKKKKKKENKAKEKKNGRDHEVLEVLSLFKTLVSTLPLKKMVLLLFMGKKSKSLYVMMKMEKKINIKKIIFDS